MKATTIFFLSLFYALSCFSQNTSTITVQTDQKIHEIKPEFWGTNFLYWIDDDSAMANGKVVDQIRKASIKVLRYPGGTIADNFHWKTSTLDNLNMFPFQSGADETNFDEFMAQCKLAGAESELVLNTETWAVRNDLSGGAHEAADWLRYCKRKGYKVRYVEIGNETYWHPIMSAEEYGKLVNVYADSLKAVDPSIILGVNGHWDINFVGTKERFKPEAYERMLHLRKNINSKKDAAAYEEFVKANTIMPITKGDTKWWNTVARICGSKIDMIIVHWYFGPNQLPMVTKKLLEVQELFAKMYPGKNFLLNMSEYNVTERTDESFMHLTEMLGSMLNAKMDLTSLWPMRMKYKKPTLLDYKTDQPSILYQIHRQLAHNLTGNLVQIKTADNIPSFASYSGTSSTLVLSGRKVEAPTEIAVNLEGKQRFHSCKVWRISGKEFEYKTSTEVLPAGAANNFTIKLNPQEIAISVFE
jgi:hypothetical protein